MNREESNETIIQAVVDRITFRNPSTGFAVVKSTLSNSSSLGRPSELVIIGELDTAIGTGTLIQARGTFQKHSKFGEQFKAFSIIETIPTTNEGLLRYFNSGAVKGFGSVLAQRALDKFEDDLVRIMDEEPHRLTEVTGIGKKKLEEILESWIKIRGNREAELFFHHVPIVTKAVTLLSQAK